MRRVTGGLRRSCSTRGGRTSRRGRRTRCVDGELLGEAARLGPAELRTLDSIHLASALLLRETIDVAIAYDARLLEAMSAAGLPAAAPA